MAAKLQAMRNWYEIKAAVGDTTEVFIYDQIGEDWFGEGVSAKNFLSELAAVKTPNIALHLNSPGGSVFDGVAIHNALVRHPARVTTYIDGLAASISSVIALAGERVIMASNALFMIHNPWGGVSGDSAEMRKMADVLDKIKETLINTYTARTGLPADEVAAAMDSESWYTAQEALALGYIDEVGLELKAAASFDLKALGFRHAPETAQPQAGVEDSPYPVTPRQVALYQALESVTETFGKFDGSTGPDGSHYTPADRNPFLAEGLVCSNCVFYEGPRACEIVAGDIDPDAICKFWVIPNDLLAPQDSPMDGASTEVASDGASETPTPEAAEVNAEAFVPGVGFVNFNRKR